MPRIYEIFGYPVEDTSEEALESRRAARCPFMGRDCDGGGNRYLSQIDLTRNEPLKALFPIRDQLAAGVCSIQVRPGTPPWVVCPRRLLVLGREEAGLRVAQKQTEEEVLRSFGYPSGTRLGVWPEVKLKYVEVVDGLEMSFDYTFDYILMPIGTLSQSEIEEATGAKWATLHKIFQRGGYSVVKQEDEYIVADCPTGVPAVVEIMTSSTSGGNKDKRSTIPMAFEDVLLGKIDTAPGINYRQVWARMASQLIVKSEIALNWGGRAVWIVQDVLVDYICASTALNVKYFRADQLDQVNLISLSYGESYNNPQGILELSKPELFAGPIRSLPTDGSEPEPSFQDIVRSPICPPLRRLVTLLAARRPINQVLAP